MDPTGALFRDLIFGSPPEAKAESEVRAWLLAHGLERVDADSLLSGGVERLFLYRTLARQTLFEALTQTLPKTLAHLGELTNEYFGRFLAEQRVRSHYLRDVCSDFASWGALCWPSDARVPPYLPDLARYEAEHIELAALEDSRESAPTTELRLDHPVRFIAACRLTRYAFAVHRLPEAPSDHTSPEREPTALLAYRSSEHAVRYLELSPLAEHVLENLLEGKALGQAVEFACAACGAPLGTLTLDGAAKLLADLAERGVLLGSVLAEP